MSGDLLLTTDVAKRFAVLAALFLAILGLPSNALAQTNTYTITPGTAINDNLCTDSTINVATSYTISDVNIGIALTHTYRSDLQISLIAPGGGTTVAVMTNTGGSGDNLNDFFDDAGATLISSHNGTVTDPTTTPPPYSHTFRPTGSLSSFNGLNAVGNWTVRICDTANVDTGTFVRADLYITQAPTNYADLSVSNLVSSATPAYFDVISYTVAVTNSSSATLDATGVVVRDLLPVGVSFVSASGFGTYNSGTGDWTVGSVPINTTRTITITVTVTATTGTTVSNIAEVTAQGQTDLDSTPNNGATGEDDYRSVSFTVAASRLAGTPPTLSCVAGSGVLDWDTTTWTAGSVSGSSTVTGIGSVAIAITTPAGATWFNNASFGGQNPAKASQLTGGVSPAQQSLHQYIDFANQTQTADTTFTLPTKVTGAQFRIYDVDFNAGQFADKVTVTGYNGATAVTPTVTNGVANYVTSAVAIGDAGSADASSNGNIVITFTTEIDRIVVAYGNHTTSPANPGGQAVAFADMTFCLPAPNLSMTKSSQLYSGNSDAFYLPGNDALYALTVANSGAGTVTSNSIFLVDPLPTSVTFFNGDANGPGGAGTDVVIFTNTSSGLTWTPATDLRYATTAPGNFAACSYTPTAGYDTNVRFVCFNPKGTMAGASGATVPGFTFQFRVKIN